MLERFSETADFSRAEPISRACLLLPASGQELRQAIALADRAMAAKASTTAWNYQYFLFAKGLADYREGNFEEAISIMQNGASKVMGPSPRLIIAMAQHRQGKSDAARQSMAAAVLSFNWSASHADSRDLWIAHILRREAEAIIQPNPPAIFEEKYQPKENDERLVGKRAVEAREQK
jgi:serine/threonine-protein kinase